MNEKSIRFGMSAIKVLERDHFPGANVSIVVRYPDDPSNNKLLTADDLRAFADDMQSLMSKALERLAQVGELSNV